jgi:hypothetical protein
MPPINPLSSNAWTADYVPPVSNDRAHRECKLPDRKLVKREPAQSQ